VIDVSGPAATARIEVGAGPVQVAYAPDGRTAYATLGGAGAVVKIDLAARRVVGRVEVDPRPVQLAVTPDGALLVVASQGTQAAPGDTVALIGTDSMRIENVIATGAGPHGVAIDPSGRQAFVTDVWAGDVAVIDLVERRVVDRIAVGGEPNGVSFSRRSQLHARGAANMDSPRVVVLPLGGRTDGGGAAGGGSHGHHHG
jgi:YVTN family beta-propeller protein